MNTTKQRGGGDPGRVVVEQRDSILLIGIDRPAKLNGFTPKMFKELAGAYTAYEKDDGLLCAVLYAEGDNFTAGLDLALMNMNEPIIPDDEIDPFNQRHPMRTKPVVCAVQGICYTAGIELMLGADIVVAAEDTRFRQHEVGRGLVAMGGATHRMPQSAGWGNAMLVLLTGDEFDPEAAFRFGFVQEVVPAGKQLDRAVEIAQTIARQAPLSVKATLEAARMSIEQGPRATIESDPARGRVLVASEDFAEGVASFKERREPVYQGQ